MANSLAHEVPGYYPKHGIAMTIQPNLITNQHRFIHNPRETWENAELGFKFQFCGLMWVPGVCILPTCPGELAVAPRDAHVSLTAQGGHLLHWSLLSETRSITLKCMSQ